MKRHTQLSLILSLLILICIPFRVYSQKIRIENPILTGALLVEKPDTESMKEICEYYNLVEEPSVNGFAVYKAPAGSTIRYKIDSGTPIVEVAVKGNRSNIKKLLEKAGYRPSKEGFVRGNDLSKSKTLCNFKSTKGVYTFTKIKNRSI